jgi:acyl-CoA synthetase (AMP-forming)/AMP-acid ligase II
MISLSSMIVRAARLNPNGIAMRYAERQFSWSQLLERVACLASGLQSFGLEAGDRVGVLSLNSDRYYESVFAIPWAGFALVPLNTRWALPENSYAVSDSGTRLLMFDDAFTEQAQSLLAEQDQLLGIVYMGEGACPEGAISYEELVENHSAVPESPRGGDDMAGIFYTGGTTGFPKGVMQSHRAIWASAMGLVPELAMTRDSVYLHVAPMFHMADFAGSMNTTLRSASHVVLQSFDPGLVLETIASARISHVLMVPAMIKMVLNHPAAANADVSSLEYLIYGASPMPAAVLEQCLELWPSVRLTQAYGQTELAPVATVLPAADHVLGGPRLKSAGLPTVVTDMRIVAEDGSDCPPYSSGEIVVRGPHVMLGYWNKPEETANALRDGWVYTGDAGYLDEDGYLFIVDRVKDMVVTGGENVFTTEVENAVISHVSVLDVAVIGIPHDEWGEAVHAIVILQPGASASESVLIEHCRQSIAGYKLPKSVSFREDALPLSGAGKVLKTELRKPYWEGRDRQVN